MKKLILDFETRSRCELKDRGVYVYSLDPSTDILCAAVKLNDEPSKIYQTPVLKGLLKNTHGLPLINKKELETLIEEADEIHAHNAQFERIMWHNVMRRYGFNKIPDEKWRCTAAKAAYHSLPRALDWVTKALDLAQKKDMTGYKVMMKMCKPTPKGNWNEAASDFLTLLQYCLQDVEAEYQLDKRLPDLPAFEQAVWNLDQKINDRGVAVDIPAVENLIFKVQYKEEDLLKKFQELTGGKVNSAKQVKATLGWLQDNGLTLENLQKETIKTALDTQTLTPEIKRLLEIRQSLGKSSVGKLKSMKNWACPDNRVRGSFLYHGASTGRWAGKGIQPHNYPRESYKDHDILKILTLGVTQVDEAYGCTIQAASKCLRGMIVPKEGHSFYCADFSQIEARVLAWLAGEDKVLSAFRSKLDLYMVAAAEIYNKPYESITKEERALGKVCVLALGYQGWLGAFAQMANIYGVRVDIGNTAGMSPEQIKERQEEKEQGIIIRWREANQKIVAFWKGVETAAISAIKDPGSAYCYGEIKYGVKDGFLKCRLPSGRLLSYYKPGIKTAVTKYGVKKEVITFWGMDSFTDQWSELTTYGGKLTENIVQAVARDLLVTGILQVEEAGYNVVMHVHDEVVAEVHDSEGKKIEDFCRVISKPPVWAVDCPIEAEGWTGKRYRKA